MSDRQKPIRDSIDEYLDDVMSEGDRRAFEDEAKNDPELLEQLDLQARIDQSLRISCRPPELRSIDINDDIVTAQPVVSWTARSQRTDVITKIALTVAVCCVIGWSFVKLSHRPDIEPFFQQESLVSIYDDIVARGFKPYYECRDPQRFAATFKRRQSKPLQLATMPEGTRMLGLSYPGGLSRDTTAMLCEVESEKVIVFVDRLAADHDNVTEQANGRSLSIFRKELDGLVFYEVTPLATERVLDFLISTSE